MCQGMPCLVDASNGLRCDDDEYVRALTKNLEVEVGVVLISEAGLRRRHGCCTLCWSG